MSVLTADFIVIGAGIAGVSVAAELSAHGRVVVLEREAQPAHHSTGRSAAILVDSYGSGPAQVLTAASRAFFEAPDFPDAPHSLLRRRGVIHLALAGQGSQSAPDIPDHLMQALTPAEAHRLVPLVPLAHISGAWLEPTAADIDVHALLSGYLRRLRAAKGQVITDAPVTSAIRKDGLWQVQAGSQVVQAPVVVNAAGAWAREIGRLFGARDIAVRPLRRTAALIDTPAPHKAADWPMVLTVDETLYFKPESGGLMVSPADENPTPPCDASPDELDLAIAMQRFFEVTGVSVPHLRTRWAGLRTFAFDRSPVIGMDREAEGFFWLAGQGGFGVQTAPAASRLAAAMLMQSDSGAELMQSWGLTPAWISPLRPGLEQEIAAVALADQLED